MTRTARPYRDETKLIIFGWVAFVVILLAGAFTKWHFEAATFNKFRDPDTPEATIWDAMFSELRVEAKR